MHTHTERAAADCASTGAAICIRGQLVLVLVELTVEFDKVLLDEHYLVEDCLATDCYEAVTVWIGVRDPEVQPTLVVADR